MDKKEGKMTPRESFDSVAIAVHNFVMTPLVVVLLVGKHLLLAFVGLVKEIRDGAGY